jgi:hypothetical protein
MKKKEELKSEKKKFNLLSNKERLQKVKEYILEKKKNILLKKKKIYITIILTTIVISLIIFGVIKYINNLRYEPYIKYEEKMNIYGFDSMYNNKSAKTSELVTKSEALKLALSTIFNTSDISNFAIVSDEYKDATWVDYAKAAKITKEDINVNNFNNNVKYIDVIEYFENCKIIFLKNESIKNIEINLKDIGKYTTSQQVILKDMIANEIISIFSNKLNGNNNIFKGQLNELVVNFAEKYNTITMPGEKININPEKIPSNASEYPYTLASVDKSVYEKSFDIQYTAEVMPPIKLFRYKKEFYAQIERFAEGYFNTILNIDYNTITEDSFKLALADYLIYKPNDYAVKSYIDNVKANQIVIVGNAKVQFPIIYSDGLSYRVRIRLTFEIKSSNTKDNLIYLDYLNGLKIIYEKNKYDLIVDYYMTNAIDNTDIYMREVDLYNSIIDKDKSGIIQEIDTETYFKEGPDAK